MSGVLQSEQVFLSYSRTDRDAAIALRAALEKAGLSVFRDEDSIRVGDNWMNRLQDTLRGCSAFVLLIGRDGVRRWVGAETQVALVRHLSPHDDAQRLPIFPILLPEGDANGLPPFLGLFQLQRWTPEAPIPGGLLQAIRDRTDLFDHGNSIDGCPYLGLAAFQPKHKDRFFGRQRETLEALKFLGSQRETNPDNIHVDTQFCR